MKKTSPFPLALILGAIFVLLPVLFFYDSFFGGKAILGTDGAYALRMYFNQFASAGYNQYWLGLFWLGQNGGSLPLNLYILAMQVFPMELSLTIAYAAMMSLSLVFTYLMLRKFKLPWYAALFGSLAYSITPHFLTLIMAGHISVVTMVAYPPMIFYFLTTAFDRKNKNLVSVIASLILAGASWGLMMGDDVQRGLYFSVVIAVFLIYKIFTGSVQDGADDDKPFAFGSIKIKPLLIGIAKAFTAGAVLLLVFINSFSTQLNSVSFKGSQGSKAAPEQTEAEKWEFGTSWSMDPAELIDSFAFGYHGAISGDPKMPYWGTKPYSGNSESIGYFVMIFAVFGIVFGFKKKEPVMKIFFWASIAALLLSFGKWFPGSPFFWLWYHLPFMDKLRIPAKFISVFAFGFSVVASFGLKYVYDIITNPKANEPQADVKKAAPMPEKREYNIVLFGIIGLFGIGFLWMMGVLLSSGSIMASVGKVQYDNMLNSLFRMNIYTALTAGIVYITGRMKQEKFRPAVYFAPLTVLLLFELLSINFFYLEKGYFKPADFFVKDSVISKIKSDPDIFRVATSFHLAQGGQFFPLSITHPQVRQMYLTHIFPYNNIEALDIPAASRVDPDYSAYFSAVINGSLPTPPQTAEDVIKANTKLLQIANVKYLVTDGYLYAGQSPAVIAYALTNNSNFSYIAGAAGAYNVPHYIFEVKNSLPRAALYENYIGMTNSMDALTAVANPVFDPNRIAVAEGVHSYIGTNISRYLPVTIEEYKPWKAVFKTSSSNGGLLLHNIKFDPVWKVYIDGVKAELVKANYIMQGVVVGPGAHQVEFRYEPETMLYKVSFFAMIASLAVGLFYLVYSLVTKPATKQEEE